ncbi:MAG TPA: TonB-dependent receptor [Vicinamibacterales bacterium]|nr:TonB-dependent receptor [Vicinamibacterales bacterium]
MRAVRIVLSLILLAAAPIAAAAQSNAAQPGRLRVVVFDPSGAVIPGALVGVFGAEGSNRSIVRTDVPSDMEGVAVFDGLPAGRYNIQVMFDGFETVGVLDLRLKAGDNMRREVTLPIKGIDEAVAVGRDAATNASDPKNGRFDTVLSKDQIDALPDDPDEMAAILEEMAGPGATMRVDGFRGGRLPPKEQIRSIRISRDPFAAENHGSGMVHIDIVTQPGIGPMRGGMNFNFADDALNARTATQPTKGDTRNQMLGFNLSGTIIPQKTSFSLSANGSSNYNSGEVNARTLEGPVAFSFRQPRESFSFNGRVDHAISQSHTVRANLMANQMESQGGVGGFSLQEQGIQNKTQGATLRLSDTGPWAKSWLNETRLQIGMNSSESRAAFENQTVRVLDSFTGGGAQSRGGRDAVDLEFASNLDYSKGKHSVRIGFLLEGEWVDTDQQSNYLGTFTFGSLEDYAAGRPLQYSIREGDPRIDYSQWQLGLFAQDDWRARPNLTVSFGVRQEMQKNLDDTLNLSPRFGLTWSPFKSGKTTVRSSLGVFNDWLESQTYGQVLQVDGVRQRETIIRNPGYPNPLDGGILQQALPASKYVLADDLSMPYTVRGSIGLQQQLRPNMGAHVQYSFGRGYDRFRGRNINAPIDGVRPDPAFGNITQVESTGGQRQHMMVTGINFAIPAKRTFLFANYTLNHTENDAANPFGLPADSYNLDAEWAPAAGMARHTVSGNLSTFLLGRFNVSLNGSVSSGAPYNITTGRDDNGDGVFLDRPAGVGRNSARGKAIFNLGGMFSYQRRFGSRSGEGGAGGTTVIMRDGAAPAAAAAGGQGQMVVMGGGGPMGANAGRYSMNLFVQGQNLLNIVNPQGYSGVMTSPFFGQPTGARPARTLSVGVRFGF